MTEEKVGWFERIYKIIGIDFMLEFGKYIIILFGSFMIVEKMLIFYISLPIGIKSIHIFTLGFMFAVMSIPIYIATIVLKEIFGESND